MENYLKGIILDDWEKGYHGEPEVFKVIETTKYGDVLLLGATFGYNKGGLYLLSAFGCYTLKTIDRYDRYELWLPAYKYTAEEAENVIDNNTFSLVTEYVGNKPNQQSWIDYVKTHCPVVKKNMVAYNKNLANFLKELPEKEYKAKLKELKNQKEQSEKIVNEYLATLGITGQDEMQ